MNDWYGSIGDHRTFSADDARKLYDAGFVVLPGPESAERLPHVAAAYDAAMRLGSEPGLKIGGSTTRLYDLVNQGPEFDGVYVHAPLLEACRQVIAGPFKVSSVLGRTLRPFSGAQDLHVDIPRGSEDLPLIGFILMIDPFRPENGATRFVPGSQRWPAVPTDEMKDLQAGCKGEVLACGPAGSMIIFNGSVWHGHTANTTSQARRSIQGYFVRREVRSGMDLSSRIVPETLARLGPLQRYLLAV